MNRSKYAYGWIHYRKLIPGIKDLYGNPSLGEEIKIYNAVDRDPDLSLSIQREQYVWSPHDPEPDPEPDLSPGVRIFRKLTTAEIDQLVKSHVDKLAREAELKGERHDRAVRRAAEKNARKFAEGKCAVFTVTEPPAEK